jgi:hypothetical protein
MFPIKQEGHMLTEIWKSFRAMPAWVQIWVAFLLVPINMAAIFFIDQPSGVWIAILAIGAMMLNMPVMLYDRGFSKLMAFPHLIPWTILVMWIAFARPVGSEGYDTYLWILLITNIISLGFDYPDALKWWKGDRGIAS